MIWGVSSHSFNCYFIFLFWTKTIPLKIRNSHSSSINKRVDRRKARLLRREPTSPSACVKKGNKNTTLDTQGFTWIATVSDAYVVVTVIFDLTTKPLHFPLLQLCQYCRFSMLVSTLNSHRLRPAVKCGLVRNIVFLFTIYYWHLYRWTG